MDYDFREIESKWQAFWAENDTYRVSEDDERPKYYVLDMFPYPSGSGLHVGHPLGYIATDIIARYKRHLGYNVLHPMGFDSFGLPAEQYAIQTGQHPAKTTEKNIQRYKQQLRRLGFNYDWSREVRTSDPNYYRWTQWIFIEFYNSWYNRQTDRAEPLDTLIAAFEDNGTYGVDAATEPDWWKKLDLDEFPFGEHFAGEFTATDWKVLTERQRELILGHFRLAYLGKTRVNWCEALGTVLANDEVKDGLSERGGHPVVQRTMEQWSLRISAYADRLLEGLDRIEWPESIKEVQRNWIGRSRGASIFFSTDAGAIEVFTTRPDTIFGTTFMVLAPEHALVKSLTTDAQRTAVEAYVEKTKTRTELERQSDVKHVTGEFTGSYATHPFTGEKLPIWIADYVLAGYGTGAIMAVPAGDERDMKFARKYDLPVSPIFEAEPRAENVYGGRESKLINSGFLTGFTADKATDAVVEELEKKGLGRESVNYRIRDAIFSRQRYWGEPFPVYYVDGIPRVFDPVDLPITLPKVDKYLPTETGDPPLARANKEDWKIWRGDRMETNTMPGWAGSSWYFLRYMDPKNSTEPVSRAASDYWGPVDFYIGGAEHGTGHLLYARFWTKFLYDRGYIGFDEPFSQMINQGMILGKSSILLRDVENVHRFVSYDKREEYEKQFPSESRKGDERYQHLRVDIHIVDGDVLDVAALKKQEPGLKEREFWPSEENFRVGHEVEKMSKRWQNVVDPEQLCDEVGADTLRMYEMFLGPVEQSKPWDTKGINGVHNFLRKFWRLAHDDQNRVSVDKAPPTRKELQIAHRCIKKVTDDLERLSWNTVVSSMMIAVNELSAINSNNAEVLGILTVLVSPYAPHFAEEMWERLGNEPTVTEQPWPAYDPQYLVDDAFDYPVSFNGKLRFKLELPVEMTPAEVEEAVLSDPAAKKYLEGKKPKKVIVVPKRIVNVVV